MALKTIRFGQGLPRTPLLFFFDNSKPDFQIYFTTKQNIVNNNLKQKTGNLEIHCTRGDLSWTRHLLVNLEKTGFSWKTGFFGPIWQLRGFWQDRSVRKNGAQLYGPRVSSFLSHRIVKSLTFMIFGKLEFQCTRNGFRNPPFCPGSIQDTFIMFSSISHHHIFQ